MMPPTQAGELIDTLWNVNIISILQIQDPWQELIDTLWNVNARRRYRTATTDTGINRYIMECKYRYER